LECEQGGPTLAGTPDHGYGRTQRIARSKASASMMYVW
jgi:hypothetical protein